MSGENELKRSSQELASKWVEYHKGVHNLNIKIENVERREKETENARLSNENFKKSLDEKEKEQIEHDRQIRDRYATLGRTLERLKK